MDAQYLAPAAFVGNADDDLAVETAGPAQRLVDCFRPVGRGDDDQVGARLQPVHQRQQLGDEALFGLAGHIAALGRDRIDFVDEQDGRRSLGRFLENLAQLLFRLAIGRTHDLGAVDQEEFGLRFIGDGAGEPGLAGARRAMEQHALWRVHAQPLEQFGIAQRQFDHLAQLVDRFGHAADIVIGDVGAPGFARFLIFGAQFHFGLGVDMDDALGRGGHDDQADFLQRIGRRGQHLAQLGRHVGGRHLLLPGGRDDIAGGKRPLEENTFQRFGIALQPQVILCGCEHDPLGRAGFDLADLDEVARTHAGIGALKPVEAQHVEPFILLIGAHHPRGRIALADDLDDVAFAQEQLRHDCERQARKAAPRIFRSRIGHLNFPSASFLIGHLAAPSFSFRNEIGNAKVDGKTLSRR